MRLGVSGSGYLTVHDGNGDWCYVHRLAAVAEHGAEAIDGADVHHINEIPKDNGRDNLRPEPPRSHRTRNLVRVDA